MRQRWNVRQSPRVPQSRRVRRRVTECGNKMGSVPERWKGREEQSENLAQRRQIGAEVRQSGGSEKGRGSERDRNVMYGETEWHGVRGTA